MRFVLNSYCNMYGLVVLRQSDCIRFSGVREDLGFLFFPHLSTLHLFPDMVGHFCIHWCFCTIEDVSAVINECQIQMVE